MVNEKKCIPYVPISIHSSIHGHINTFIPGLLTNFGKGEFFTPRYREVVSWLDNYNAIVFVVRQFAWPIMYMHCYVSQIFFLISRRITPISTLQRKFKYWVAVVLAVTALSITLETMAHTGRLDIHPLTIEVTFSGASLCFVVFSYGATCYTLARNNHGSSGLEHFDYVIKARNAAIAKLLAILGAFIFVWSWMVGCSIQFLYDDNHLAIDVSSGML